MIHQADVDVHDCLRVPKPDIPVRFLSSCSDTFVQSKYGTEYPSGTVDSD